MTLTSRKDRAAALAERIGHLWKERQIIEDKLFVMRAELEEIVDARQVTPPIMPPSTITGCRCGSDGKGYKGRR